jgi:serpin B
MMHRMGTFYYCNGRTFQALEIPYKGKELSMIVLLPHDGVALPALEQSLTPGSLKEWLDQPRPASNVMVTMPKFKVAATFGLAVVLNAMGMQQAFSPHVADFSGIASKETMRHDGNLFVSAVIHKANVDVDEEGTEAAVTTAVMINATKKSPPFVVVRTDHPFLFAIRDNRSGGILFMGRITDPLK